jgi:putative heme transporter
MTRSRACFDAVLAGPRWCLRRVRRWFGHPDPTVRPQAEDEFFAAICAVRSTPRRCAPLLAAAAGGKLISALSLYAILAGVGVHLGIATTVVIFVLTLVASAVGPFPAGLGTTEASLGALLVSHGVAGPVAAGAVLLFRVLDLWLPIAVGGVAALLRARPTAVILPAPLPSLPVAT